MRRLIIITLAWVTGLGTLALAASAIRSAGARGHFTLSVTPGHQSAVRGGTARFSVTVARTHHFAGAVTLNTSDLPRGVSASWQLADGTRGGVVPPSETGATLILRTSPDTPMGTRRVKVMASGAGTTRMRALALTLAPNSQRRFSLSVSPARLLAAPGASATYTIHIARAAHFHGRVSLRMLQLPSGARATWTTNAVRVTTKADQPVGSHRLVLEGTSIVDGRALRRNAVVVLSVVQAREFHIRGGLTVPLYPGAGAPLDLVLTNPNRFDLRVVALSVRLGAATTNAGCGGDENYAVGQYRGRYPLRLRPGTTRLHSLVLSPSLWPRVSMRDLPTNQDACKGAVVSLRYRGTATQ
ncbi:MAG: hypothetical protein QOJ35_2159 [Solirubrobacteraceae bacterium]|nr:hypothetical protein [Solirubrobacteraceae bacterium]